MIVKLQTNIIRAVFHPVSFSLFLFIKFSPFIFAKQFQSHYPFLPSAIRRYVVGSPPAHSSMRHDRRLNYAEILVTGRAMGFRETTNTEIDNAISAGTLRAGNINQFSHAARFWAAIRRLQTDCSIPPTTLARVYNIPRRSLAHYWRVKSTIFRSLHAADELEAAAFKSLRREN